MMLPSDLVLIEDPDFKVYVDLYAKDQKTFFKRSEERRVGKEC